MITTQKDLRLAFWRAHPSLGQRMTAVGKGLYRPSVQNEYPADTRVAWCGFVEAMTRDGQISEALAERATL